MMKILIVLSLFYLLSTVKTQELSTIESLETTTAEPAETTTVKTLNLKNICKEDHFLYEKQQVNAYYHLSLEKTLPQLEFYYIELKDELKNTITIELVELLANVKKQYNRLMFKVYSEKFLSKLNASREIYRSKETLNGIRKATDLVFEEIFNLHKETPAILHLRALFARKFKNFENLLDLLIDLRDEKIVKELLPKDELHGHLVNIDGQLMTNQFPIFQDELTSVYYTSNLYKMTSFQFVKAAKLFFSLESYGKIRFSMYIPFYDSQYTSDENCTPGKDLPKFFKGH